MTYQEALRIVNANPVHVRDDHNRKLCEYCSVVDTAAPAVTAGRCLANSNPQDGPGAAPEPAAGEVDDHALRIVTLLEKQVRDRDATIATLQAENERLYDEVCEQITKVAAQQQRMSELEKHAQTILDHASKVMEPELRKLAAENTAQQQRIAELLILCNTASAILQCVQTGTAHPESIAHMIEDLQGAFSPAANQKENQ